MFSTSRSDTRLRRLSSTFKDAGTRVMSMRGGPRGIRFGLIPVGRLSDQLVELVIRQVLVGLPGIRDETPQTPLLGSFFQLALGILGLAGRIPICQ